MTLSDTVVPILIDPVSKKPRLGTSDDLDKRYRRPGRRARKKDIDWFSKRPDRRSRVRDPFPGELEYLGVSHLPRVRKHDGAKLKVIVFRFIPNSLKPDNFHWSVDHVPYSRVEVEETSKEHAKHLAELAGLTPGTTTH